MNIKNAETNVQCISQGTYLLTLNTSWCLSKKRCKMQASQSLLPQPHSPLSIENFREGGGILIRRSSARSFITNCITCAIRWALYRPICAVVARPACVPRNEGPRQTKQRSTSLPTSQQRLTDNERIRRQKKTHKLKTMLGLRHRRDKLRGRWLQMRIILEQKVVRRFAQQTQLGIKDGTVPSVDR